MDIITSLNNTFFANVPTFSGVLSAHFHESYTIGLTNSGLMKAFSNKKCYDAYEYSVRVTNPYDVHGGEMQHCQFTNFYPTIELLTDIYEQIHGERQSPLFEDHIIKDYSLYTKLYDFFHAVFTKADSMMIEIHLIEVLAYLITHYASKTMMFIPQHEGNIHHSIEFIHDTIGTSVSLDSLAHHSQMSKYYFLRQFKAQLGITPHHYILYTKVQKAKDLIMQGKSIAEASLEMGFSDQSHFTRHFKKIHGYTPGILNSKGNFVLYSEKVI